MGGQGDRALADCGADGEAGGRKAFEAGGFIGQKTERLQRLLDAEALAVPGGGGIGHGEGVAVFGGACAEVRGV